MQFNTLAKAALRYNKKLQMYKLIAAFNVTETNAKGNYKFPVEKKCNYVSGHFELAELGAVLQTAEKHLRTSNIVVVE
jgi:hypothetical protein